MSQSSFEREVFCPVDSTSLIVSSRFKAQLDRSATHRHIRRQQVASIDLVTVRSNRVDLSGLVSTLDDALAPSPRTATSHNDNITMATCPFALHPQELRREIKNKVIRIVSERNRNDDPELDCLANDRRLRDQSLLICRQLKQRSQPSERLGWAVS